LKIDYRRLRAVIHVADELSFSRAAERMNVSQPALSAQVRGLEEELGFQLFDRSTRRVALTEDGKRFVGASRRVIEETDRLERFVRTLRRQAHTRLIIGTPIYTIDFDDRVTFLERLVEEFVDTRVEIVTAVNQTEIVTELTSGHLDLAVLMGVPVDAETYRRALALNQGRESLYDQSLRTVVLAERPVSLLVPSDSTLAARRELRAADLGGHKVAVPGAFHGQQICQPIERYLESAGAEPVLPPEPNAIGVERYGRQFKIPAISLGWFPQPGDSRMIRCPIADLDLRTRLVLAGHSELTTPSIERAFSLARNLVSEQAHAGATKAN
jgi:DNA-binding transcriptional LysR family regulator